MSQLSIDQVLSKAKKAIKQGNKALAAQLFNAVLQRQPNHTVAKKGLRKLQKTFIDSQGSQSQISDPPQGQINALITAYRSGQMEKAEESCRELLSIFPESLIVTNILGAALQVQGKLEEAVGVFDRAIELKPDFADAYGNRGNALKDLGQLANAIASYDKAIELKPDLHVAFYNRGNALKDHGRLEDAVASYEKAIQIKPDFAQAHRSLSALKTYRSDDEQVKLLERLLTDESLSEPDRTELCFALGKAFEDLGDWDKSFSHLEEGNRLRKGMLAYNIDTDKDLFDRIKGIFADSPPDFGPQEAASIQPIFVVGMMRSGTSLVEQILASHSQVHGGGELEAMNLLVDTLVSKESQNNGLTVSQITTLRNEYLKALSVLRVPEKIITDKMPTNFRWIGFMLSAFPQAKVIHLSRDPIATCWSIYKHYFPAEGNGYAYDLKDLAEFHKLYLDIMAFWRHKYPNNIYDLNYEKLTENQEEETRKLLAYCDLDWEPQCLDFQATERVVKTSSAAQVRQGIFQGSSEAWKTYADHLQPLVKALGY